MFVYIVSLFLIIAGILLTFDIKSDSGTLKIDKGKLPIQKGILMASILYLVFLFSFRSMNVGNDTRNYLIMFKDMQSISIATYWQDIEKGYLLINKIIGTFTSNYNVYLFIISLLIFIPLYNFLIDNSKNPLLSIYIYITIFSIYSFTIFRQAIAISFILLSFYFIKRKKPVKFILLVFIASLIHISALIFIIAYPISKIKITPIYITFSLFGALLLFICRKFILSILSLFFPTYIFGGNEGMGMLIILIVMLLGSLYLFSFSSFKFPGISFYVNMIIMALYTQIFALEFPLFVRAGLYFQIFLIIYIPNVIESMNDKLLKFLLMLIVIGVLFIYFIFSLNLDSMGLVPYSFF